MIILITLISVIALFMIFLLITPFYVYVNSNENDYRIGLKGVIKVAFKPGKENILAIELFSIYQIHPLQKINNKTKRVKSKGKNKKRVTSWKRIKFWISVFWQIVKKSKLKKLYLDVDTGDMAVNGFLFPIFAMINAHKAMDMNINFNGNFSLVADVRNNLFNILIIIIKNFYRRYFLSND